MGLRCVGAWLDACVCAVNFFDFGGLGWGGQLGSGRGGLVFLTAAHQDRYIYLGAGVK